MGWFKELYEIYAEAVKLDEAPLPVGFEERGVHIMVQITSGGNFNGAQLLGKKEKIAIPVTEESASRTSGIAAHPLFDTLEYVAKNMGDYMVNDSKRKDISAETQNKFSEYEKLLSSWYESPHTHPLLIPVLKYIRRGTLIKDLLDKKILHLGEDGKFSQKSDCKQAPEIFKLVSSQEKAMICWLVDGKKIWLDKDLQKTWSDYYLSLGTKKDFCYVLGEERPVARLHTKNIIPAASNAKLISSNDKDGYTYRGRFSEAAEAAVISTEVSAKAHAALKWLIERQGYKNGSQTYVAWATALKDLPKVMETPETIYDDDDFSERETVEHEQTDAENNAAHLGLRIGKKIKDMIAGRSKEFVLTDNIMLLGLDVPTEGRMSVTYFRQFGQKDFFNTLEQWYHHAIWYRRIEDKQNPGKKRLIIGTFTPNEISAVVYGRDGNARKEIVKRLLPCIVEGRDIPEDIVKAAVNKASDPYSFKSEQDWMDALAVACALYRCHSARKYNILYDLELDKSCRSRDYLFGRLLAVAENIEEYVLKKTGTKRITNAEKYMPRFSIHPFNTWQELFEKMIPYAKLLFSKEAENFYYSRVAVLQEIYSKFNPLEFTNSRSKLSGEFLLGYDLQQRALYRKYTGEKGDSSIDRLNRSKDYLFGRLLAVAVKIEESAMDADKKRLTNAEAAIPQFSLKQLPVWKTVFEKTLPYGERLITQERRGLYAIWTQILEEIHNLFTPETFTDSGKLSGEYILGYFAQRKALQEEHSDEIQESDLDENYRSRDYLYGRLLAFAKKIEERALYLKDKIDERPTNAERYMRAFSVRPHPTWEHILMKVRVHKDFLRAHSQGLFYKMMNDKIKEIEKTFNPGDFESDAGLSGEYLLGYFKQLYKFRSGDK
jgi:CRISPR-associated protein Csd1